MTLCIISHLFQKIGGSSNIKSSGNIWEISGGNAIFLIFCHAESIKLLNSMLYNQEILRYNAETRCSIYDYHARDWGAEDGRTHVSNVASLISE